MPPDRSNRGVALCPLSGTLGSAMKPSTGTPIEEISIALHRRGMQAQAVAFPAEVTDDRARQATVVERCERARVVNRALSSDRSVRDR